MAPIPFNADEFFVQKKNNEKIWTKLTIHNDVVVINF